MKIRTFIIALTLLISSIIEINLNSGCIIQFITILYISMFLILNRKKLKIIEKPIDKQNKKDYNNNVNNKPKE